MMQFSPLQASCLAVMDIPLWQRRLSDKDSVWQARHVRFTVASVPAKSAEEHVLWSAILTAITLDESAVDTVPASVVSTIELGKAGVPSLSEMIETPALKAILWQRLQL